MMYVRMLVALFAVLVATPDWAMATTERSVDASASKVGFQCLAHLRRTRNGNGSDKGGAATFANDSLIPESVTVTLDATRVSTGDPDQTGCIQSPDYFDVKKFPTWTFASTKITPYTATSFGIEGTLTMHGVTQPEHFSVTIQNVGESSGLSCDRSNRPARLWNERLAARSCHRRNRRRHNGRRL